ncbi:MAG: hypothetical protein FWG43_00450 [Clostridiales bacterium]|nr:hypothetical protein [Clostridiales bacterium]
MWRGNRVIFISIGILIAAIMVLTLLNRTDAVLFRALQENREFLLKLDGETVAIVSLRDIMDMQPVEFTTRLATSITKPREARLRGVELRLIYEALDIDVSAASLFAIRGLDNYFSPLTFMEVETADKVYICFSMDGEILQALKDGGWGPFLLVIRGELFAQRWCKYVEEIDAQV